MSDVSIIVPAFNEEERLSETLIALRTVSYDIELIVVNDGSKDRTQSIAKQHADHVIYFQKNKGKGQALQAGWRVARGAIIACVDADLGDSAKEITKLIEPVEQNKTDVAISLIAPKNKAGFGLVKRRAQAIVLKETGTFVQAPLSGQRAFRRSWLSVLLQEDYNGFGVETKMTIDFIQHGASILEVETSMTHREMGKTVSGFLHRFKQWREIEHLMRVERK